MPIQIEFTITSVFTQLAYSELLAWEVMYKEEKQDNVLRALYKDEYLHAKEMYQKAVQYDRLENQLTSNTIIIY